MMNDIMEDFDNINYGTREALTSQDDALIKSKMAEMEILKLKNRLI